MADNSPIKFEVGAKPGKALKRKNERMIEEVVREMEMEMEMC